VARRTLHNEAVEVLRAAGTPLHVNEIWRRIAKRGNYRTASQTPEQSLATQLLRKTPGVQVSAATDEKLFSHEQPSVFGLLEWQAVRKPIGRFDEKVLATANIAELRKAALLKARPNATRKERLTVFRVRSRAIHLYVMYRANGRCEARNAPAPFRKPDGSGYLEPHHTTRLADEGPDHPAKVIGLCPNCHRRAHYGKDAKAFNTALIKKLGTLEPNG
jgi:hypothetical protein